MTTEAFHEEVLAWILSVLTPGRAFVLGVNGPQGCGKTTLTTALCRRLGELGKRAVTVSVDDFYLTRAGQRALAAAHPANPYLRQRGYPGTHDVALGTRTLAALRSPAPGRVRIPRYDKSRHGGEGDREPPERWAEAETPLDLVLFEGWMLGFPPVPEQRLPSPALREINEALAAYRAWNESLEGFLQLEPEDPRFVLGWRVEAEERMKAAGKPGMSEAAIRAYVEKFLPAYEIYLPALAERPPVARNLRRIRIGKNRLPAGARA
jgi:D-glycerate 3-kinase